MNRTEYLNVAQFQEKFSLAFAVLSHNAAQCRLPVKIQKAEKRKTFSKYTCKCSETQIERSFHHNERTPDIRFPEIILASFDAQTLPKQLVFALNP